MRFQQKPKLLVAVFFPCEVYQQGQVAGNPMFPQPLLSQPVFSGTLLPLMLDIGRINHQPQQVENKGFILCRNMQKLVHYPAPGERHLKYVIRDSGLLIFGAKVQGLKTVRRRPRHII